MDCFFILFFSSNEWVKVKVWEWQENSLATLQIMVKHPYFEIRVIKDVMSSKLNSESIWVQEVTFDVTMGRNNHVWCHFFFWSLQQRIACNVKFCDVIRVFKHQWRQAAFWNFLAILLRGKKSTGTYGIITKQVY